MSLGGRPKEVEQHSYRAAKQLLPGRPPKLIHTLTPLHATSLTAMRRHGVLGPLGLGLQAPPLPHCILPYGADARVHAEHGVPGTRSCGLFCLSAERQLALSGLAPFAALCAAPAERQLALSGLAPFRPRAAPAERQLCLSGLAPLLPIHGTAADRGSGGATALPHLVQAPGTECALQLARCASGSCTAYSVSLYASAICPLSGCTSAPYLDRCMGPLRMA